MFSQGFTGAFVALLAGAQLATAHMEIKEPAPFRSRFNPNSNPASIDYTNTAPLDPSGANFPCKGYHSDLGTAAGKSVASYAPGSSYQFTVDGQAPHGGGSCQVSLSYDGGKTFTVIQSIIGGCPLSSTYPFTIPSDAPEGEAIWAWTWSNKIGNREQYMNCAAVTISKGAKKRNEPVKRASVGFSSRPALFVANLKTTTCEVAEGTDVVFPNPGPDILTNGGNQQPPSGNCGASGPGGGNGGGNTSPAPSTSAQAPVVTPTPTPSKPVSLPGGVFITVPGSASSSSAPAPVETPVESPVVQPTTLIVSTRPAATSTQAAVPAPSQGAGNGGAGYVPGTACASEGAWNCIGGSSFQRCASGVWSATISMAAGTKCTAGESQNLQTVKVRRSFRRHGHGHGSKPLA
ncbi:hypothetical protein QBC38DRAFT_158449 [Podospora fimiseda]|uniref:Extracellular protein n=1 Tax=Podospora fimiseda TaxID=252190 RepID=A0AAN7BRT2_9PEZI|nr:hypothetical protein QBC38DRAFT_158449 [Podospora fimiseda]